MSNYKKNSLRSMSVLMLIFIGSFIFMLLRPGQAKLSFEESEVVVTLDANRNWVWNADDCVTVTWQADHINAIYLDGGGVVGSGEREFCRTADDDSLELRVDYHDTETVSLLLELPLVWQLPLFWLMTGLIILCLIVMIFTIIAPQPGANQGQQTESRFKPIFAIIRLVLINIVVIAVLLEILLRLYFGFAGTEQQKGMYLYNIDRLRQENNTGIVPFLNYSAAGEQVNNLGYRDPDDLAIPKPDGTYRIAVLGGSTTFGLLLEAGEAYPARLENALRNDYGYTHVEVVNAGVIGYDSWNSLVNLSFRVLELDPDMIIIYHAMNDMHPREDLLPECYRGLNAHRGLNPEAAVLQLNSQTVSPSTLHRFAFINFGWMDNPVALDGSLEQTIPCYYESEVSDMPVEERVMNNPPVYFERNMETMVLIAQAYDIEVMLSTWTYAANVQGQYSASHWINGIVEHNAITTDLAEEHNTLFFDLASTDIATDSTYWFDDYIHQSREGHRYQGELFAEYLDSTGVLATP